MRYDLFVSYRRKDLGSVLPLVDVLRHEHRLKVWLDQSDIETFESSTVAIANGLATSRAMLVWYSAIYPESRPCQWELTNGFLAAARHGPPADRILVVNPEEGNAHIHPVELRDQNFQPVAGKAAQEIRAAARAIAKHVETLGPAALGESQRLTGPSWYGRSPVSSNRFVGRLAPLWRIHSGLHGTEHGVVAKESVPVVQVRGLGGLGKSLLAEEYALRFGATFRAGVFWLQAPGPGASEAKLSEQQVAASRETQFHAMAIELGAKHEEVARPEAVRPALRARLDELTRGAQHGAAAGWAFLWIVDDLPTGLSRVELDRWIAPHPLGKTLITTRSREHDGYGIVIDLEEFREAEALALLTMHQPPVTDAELAAAQSIIRDLGALPLAIDVAGAALRKSAGLASYISYRDKLARPGTDALEFAARLAGELPSGHTASVTGTLLTSIDALEQEGRDFLRLAAQLAAAPIPSDLVARTFVLVNGTEADAATERAILAFHQCQTLSLCEQANDALHAAQRVHALVARTVRLHDRSSARQADVHAAVTRALLEVLPKASDPREHAMLGPYIVHARHLLAGNPIDPSSLEVLGWIARFDYEQGYYESAAQLCDLRVQRSRALLGPLDETTLLAMGDLARALQGLARLKEAAAVEEQVLEGRRRILGDEHVDTLTAMNNLAATLAGLRNFERALELQKRVLETRRRVLGPEHEDTLFAINNYGATLAGQGRLDEARPLLEEAYALRSRLLGGDHPDSLASGSSLAAVLFRQGEFERARELGQSIADARTRILGPDHPSTLYTECNLGRILIAQGTLNDARTLLTRTVEFARRRLGSEHPTTLLALNNLARALAALGELDAALPFQTEAFEGQRSLRGERDDFTARYAMNLFELRLRLQDTAGARGVFACCLQWLLEADPCSLRVEQQEIRGELAAHPGLHRVTGGA